MKYRKLRIAWSVAWGVVAVLLCVLWVRSYWWFDVLSLNTRGHAWSAMVLRGDLGVQIVPTVVPAPVLEWHIGVTPAPAEHTYSLFDGTQMRAMRILAGVHFGTSVAVTAAWFPFPLILVATLLTGALPWLRWRFSLRTLLIATTLIAVIMGLVVWLR